MWLTPFPWIKNPIAARKVYKAVERALWPWPNSMAEPEAESSQTSLQRSSSVMLLGLSLTVNTTALLY